MKNLKLVFTILFALVTMVTAFAQSNPYGEYAGSDNNRHGSRRFARRCTEPFPARSFNRDYVGMSNTNFYHIDKELRDYTKGRCLTAEQIRRLTLLLPTDREKYDYLTYSLNYVFDIENISMAGSVLVNRNAKDAFYRFLVREGVPAGDYFSDPYYAGGAYCSVPPPQYDRYGNAYSGRFDNRNNPNNDPYYSNNSSNGRDYYGNQNYDNRNNNQYDNQNHSSYRQGQVGVNSGYRGLMTYQEFEILKDKIKQNTFEKGKLDAAKLLTKENVLTTNQVAEIVRMFNLDGNRLEYAKFAYEFVYDRENFAAVGDAMSFEKSRKELQRYVETNRKG